MFVWMITGWTDHFLPLAFNSMDSAREYVESQQGEEYVGSWLRQPGTDEWWDEESCVRMRRVRVQ